MTKSYQDGLPQPGNHTSQSSHCQVSVVVPVYNEHKTVAQVVGRLLELEIVGEVVIVDDGSDEPTRRVLDRFAAERRVRMLRHPENRGKGAALRSGFAVCVGQVIVVQDADLEYSPEALPEVVRAIIGGEADVVYGSRELGSSYQGVTCVRTAANRLLTRLSNQLTGLRLTDMETGCKAFSRSVVESLTIEEDRFGVEPELTAKVAAAGWRVVETPVDYWPRSYREGKKIRFRDGLWALRCVIRYSRPRVLGCRKKEGKASDHNQKPRLSSDVRSADLVSGGSPLGFK